MPASKAPLPPLPPGVDLGLVAAHMMAEGEFLAIRICVGSVRLTAPTGYVFQKVAKPEATAAGGSSAPVDPNMASSWATLKSRYTRDPDRPEIKITWCPEPTGGSAGRENFKVDKLLCMTRKAFLQCRGGIKKLLMPDPEIDMNKAITKNNPDAITRVVHQAAAIYPEFDKFRKQRYWPLRAIILLILKSTSGTYNTNRRALEDEAAAARGEVIERRKKAPALPTTARGKAKLKELKAAKKSKASDPTSDSSSSTGGTVPGAGQVTVPGAGNEPNTPDNNLNGDPNANPDGMETDVQEVSAPLEGVGDEGVGDIIVEMKSMNMGSTEDDEPAEDTGNILGPVNPQAASTPLPVRAHTQASSTSTTHHEPDSSSTSINAHSSEPVANTATPSQPTFTKSHPSLPPPQLFAQGASSAEEAHTPTHPPVRQPPTLASQIAGLNALAATLGPAQLALLPPGFFESLTALQPSSVPTSTPNPAPSPVPNLNAKGGLSGDESELSEIESTSESNPPVVNQGPKTASAQAKDRKNKKPAKRDTGAQVVLPGADDGEPGSAGARVARAIRAAKNGKGGTLAKGASTEDEDQPVEKLAPVSTKKTGGRSKAKTVVVTADNEGQAVVKPPTRKSARKK